MPSGCHHSPKPHRTIPKAATALEKKLLAENPNFTLPQDGHFEEIPEVPEVPKRKKGGRQPGAGRPVREFDKKIFQGLCHVHCTFSEIKAILSADEETLNRWCLDTYDEDFPQSYKRFAEGGKASVRRNQFNLSKSNSSMCIWLGKVLLGQRDMAEVDERINKALGILDAAKKLRVVDDHANTVAETVIEPPGSEREI